MRPRPTALTVLCIIGIIWASLGGLGTLLSLGLHFITFPASPPALDAMKREPLVIAMTFGLGLTSLLVDAVLLAGSIKSLKLEKSGRGLLRVYMIAKLLVSVVTVSWAYGYMVPRTFALTMVPGRPLPPGFAVGMHIGIAVGSIVSIVFALAMPLYILLTLRLRSVGDAYAGIYVAQGSFEPLVNKLSGE